MARTRDTLMHGVESYSQSEERKRPLTSIRRRQLQKDYIDIHEEHHDVIEQQHLIIEQNDVA